MVWLLSASRQSNQQRARNLACQMVWLIRSNLANPLRCIGRAAGYGGRRFIEAKPNCFYEYSRVEKRSFVSYNQISAIGFDAVRAGFAAMYAIWLSTNSVIMKKVLSHTWGASTPPLEMKSLKGDTLTYNEVRGYKILDGSICQTPAMVTREFLVRYPRVADWIGAKRSVTKPSGE